jgi:hypothetical protein
MLPTSRIEGVPLVAKSIRLLSVGFVLTLLPGVALAANEACDSGKLKCVGARTAGVLACHSAAEKDGTVVGAICLQKSYDKFTFPGKDASRSSTPRGPALRAVRVPSRRCRTDSSSTSWTTSTPRTRRR